MRVRDLMTTDLITLDETDSLNLAQAEMSLARIRHLPVVRKGRLVGLVTHRDILRAMCSVFSDLDATEHNEVLRNILVKEIMATHVVTIGPDADAAEAGRRLLAGKLGCLPVVEEGRLVGILTEADFVALAVEHIAAASRGSARGRGEPVVDAELEDDDRPSGGGRRSKR
jgi:CBS domain-containing membrane protein